MKEKYIPTLRKVGMLLIFIPAVASFVFSERSPDGDLWSSPFFWFFVLIVGLYFAGLRTEKENKVEIDKKRERYSRTVSKFRAQRIRFMLKASVVAILALFPIALLSVVFNSMNIFWTVVVLIAAFIALVVFTDNPDRSILSKRPNQSEQDNPIIRP
jgi:asparagine N-glycosylation enzyme membrane subunit Stt3